MLTSTEMTQIRFYLGQSTLFRYKNPRLEGIWGALDADAETLIRNILAQLAVVDAKLLGGNPNIEWTAGNAAGVKAVEEIQFFGGESGGATTTQLARLGRILVSRLSSIVGVPVYADVYAQNGWPGDSYSANGGLTGGNGSFGLG